MKKYIITIDMGTTNTRVMLWDQNKSLVSESKIETGAHVTAMDGNNKRLRNDLNRCILQTVLDGKITFEQVQMVVASGMITSELGLYEIPHILTPVGIEEVMENVVEQYFEDICPIPILLIPGIKNQETDKIENIDTSDMMRGEEVEVIGLMSNLPKDKSYILVLPGSHTKVVYVNECGQIVASMTTLGGELLEAVTKYTILSDATEREFVKKQCYQKKWVLEGQKDAKKWGMTRALFGTRIKKVNLKQSTTEIQNYLLGIVLQSDVEAIKKWIFERHLTNSHIVVTGKEVLRRALVDIMKSELKYIDLCEYPEDLERPFSAIGAMIVGSKYLKIK